MSMPGVRCLAVFSLCVLVSFSAQAAIPASERSALVALYESTGGAAWTDRTGWLGAPGTECSWHGVECNDAGAAVVAILLTDNNLVGVLPTQLGSLSSLERLELAANQLSGPVPQELSPLRELRHLDLSVNELTGPLPPFIGELTNLNWLDLHGNQLTGALPESFSALVNLTWLDLRANPLGGSIPPWIDGLMNLEGLLLGGTQLTGSIPDAVVRLANLSSLVLTENRLTGPIPAGIGDLRNLAYLTLDRNRLSGDIPAGLWTLTELRELRLDDNELTGSIPSSVGQLTLVEVMLLGTNHLSGEIPAEIGGLQSVIVLGLGANRFEGSIPSAIGNLSRLEALDLDKNRLRGAVPGTLMNLGALADGGLRLDYNLLHTSDAALRLFLESKAGPEWESTQTVPPTGIVIGERTDRSIVVSWNPIAYQGESGGYEVVATPSSGAPIIATTASKSIDSVLVRGTEPSTTYSISVRSTTHPHGFQQNFLRSDPAPAVSATTAARQFRPAEVDVVRAPTGLIRAGDEAGEDSFVLANFGDVATSITLGRTDTFFVQTPETFVLEPGATQTVTLRAADAIPAGNYYGYSVPQGAGVPEGFLVQVILLAVETAEGAPVAEALSTRIDVTGDVGVDSVGTASFRNVGSADLAGVLLSDVAWIRTRPEPIAIPRGEIRSVSFDIIRSRRPVEIGAVSGTIRFVYVAGGSGSAEEKILRHSGRGSLPRHDSALEVMPANGVGVSTTLVTVVDTAKPPIGPGSIPPLGPGEIARFVPGIASLEAAGSRQVSDLVLTNSFSALPVTDLRLFYRAAGGGSSSVATLGSLAPTQTVGLADVVSVYGAPRGVGSLHVRSRDADKMQVSATLVDVIAPGGPRETTLPVFRSDRVISGSESLHLAGIPSGSSERSVLYLQETAGGVADARIEFLNASGARLGEPVAVTIGGFEMRELGSIVPAGASTAVVALESDSSGDLAAFALVTDGVDRWPVVDWRSYSAIAPESAQRLAPVVSSRGAAPPRRRAVRRGSAGGASVESSAGTEERTSVAIFNAGAAPGSARLTLQDATGASYEREVTVGARQTISIDDAVAFVRGAKSDSVGTLTVTPLGASLHVTARVHGSGRGYAVPVQPATAGARLGQSLSFAGLHDSTRATVESGRGGTYRTGFGISEVSGRPVKVRAEIVLVQAGSRVSSQNARDYDMGANQTLYVEDMLRSILGEVRETRFGDLRNLRLDLRVVGGEGAAVFFVRSEDNGSGDAQLRVE